MTWLDTQPQHQVEAALAMFDDDPGFAKSYLERAGGDSRYGLYLVLVDLQMSTLPDRGQRPAWDWHTTYRAGWSPRTAAFAAWASTAADLAPSASITSIAHCGADVR